MAREIYRRAAAIDDAEVKHHSETLPIETIQKYMYIANSKRSINNAKTTQSNHQQRATIQSNQQP
jgi:hypothetical protein